MKSVIRLLLSAGGAIVLAGALISGASADTDSTNDTTLEATNGASSSQTGTAVSGDATSTGSGIATTGYANSNQDSDQKQRISQRVRNVTLNSALCTCDLISDNTTSATGTNSATQGQDSLAASGFADAAGLSDATMGNADQYQDNFQKQRIRQRVVNRTVQD